MQRLSASLSLAGTSEEKLVRSLDSWASEVLHCRKDALGLAGEEAENRALDHFFGTVVARDRLERRVGSSDFYLVAAIDALFVSFTEDVGRDWTLLTGLESMVKADGGTEFRTADPFAKSTINWYKKAYSTNSADRELTAYTGSGRP